MNKSIELNSITSRLPRHLHKFIVDQNYEHYTARDQAIWRYVMRINTDYLARVAHHSYSDGLKKTGIALDRIPNMTGMNRILKEIGWAAVSVDGFIPPNAFMEFQAYNVLVIAADIRTLEHIHYTPAPDIIHEAAGHAPIIANPEYAEYLRRFGEIGSKAISSSHDYEMYEAIRLLSILKEDPNALPEEVQKAEDKVNELQQQSGELSEMAQIRNLHWWTVEYGLIGTLDAPKIYGAGLLSSIGESKWCLKDEVQKIPYTIEAAKQRFDITKPQPQLYVTPDFAHLSTVLEAFANTMSLRKGGLKGVQKLIDSKHIGTVELSTGIQISGVFSNVIAHEDNAVYFQTTGPTALASRDKELIGHGVAYHAAGFGSPVGKLKGINLAIENMSPRDLEIYGIYEGRQTSLLFEGDIEVSGEVITGKRDLQGKILLISFRNCTVRQGETILFHPDWGIYDMVVGASIIAAYAGPASPESFPDLGNVSDVHTKRISYNEDEIKLHELYKEVAKMRNDGVVDEVRIAAIFQLLDSTYSNEWLLLLELYELSFGRHVKLAGVLKNKLIKISAKEAYKDLVSSGLALIDSYK